MQGIALKNSSNHIKQTEVDLIFGGILLLGLNCAPPARLPVLQPFLGQEEDKTKTRSNLYIDDHGLWAPCSPLG